MGGPSGNPGAKTCRSGGLDRRGWRPSCSGQRVRRAVRAGIARKALARGDHATPIHATQRVPETIAPKPRAAQQRLVPPPSSAAWAWARVQGRCARSPLPLVVVAAKCHRIGVGARSAVTKGLAELRTGRSSDVEGYDASVVSTAGGRPPFP